MRRVDRGEIEQQLAELLGEMQGGQVVLITEEGVPVAKLMKIGSPEPLLERLVRKRIVTPPTKSLPDDFFDRPRPKAKGEPTSQTVIRERREGR